MSFYYVPGIPVSTLQGVSHLILEQPYQHRILLSTTSPMSKLNGLTGTQVETERGCALTQGTIEIPLAPVNLSLVIMHLPQAKQSTITLVQGLSRRGTLMPTTKEEREGHASLCSQPDLKVKSSASCHLPMATVDDKPAPSTKCQQHP